MPGLLLNNLVTCILMEVVLRCLYDHLALLTCDSTFVNTLCIHNKEQDKLYLKNARFELQ